MSHKKPKNRQFSSEDKHMDKISELKNRAGLDHPTCKVDHSHDHNCDNEPFSFAQESSKNKFNKQQKEQPNKAASNPFNADLVNDLMQSFNNNFNFSNNMMGNNVGSSQVATKLIQEMLVDTSAYLSSTLKDNMNIGKDFVACKDIKDIINFQNNLFKANFSNILDYTIKISNLMQNFVADQVNVSGNWLDRNTKIVTSQS